MRIRPIRKLFPMFAALLMLAGCATTEPQSDIWAGPDWPVFTDAAEPLSERAAMDQWREANPNCAVCGVKRCIVSGHRNNVHHIQPRARRPDLAACSTNFVTLCRTHHFWIGHMRNWKTHNKNLPATIKAVRKAYDDTAQRAP